MTFSVIARDHRAGEFGVATASAEPGVGAVVPHVEAGIGAIVTQGAVDARLTLDRQVLDRLRAGDSAESALRAVLERDAGRAERQIGVVAARGRAVGWTGARCAPSAGHQADESFIVLGNVLGGTDVLRAMAHAMQGSAHLALAERLLQALAAGDTAGGDRRGRRSAALRVVGPGQQPQLDLRVDDDPDPVQQLRRAYLGAPRQMAARSPAGGRMATFAQLGVQMPQATPAPPLTRGR